MRRMKAVSKFTFSVCIALRRIKLLADRAQQGVDALACALEEGLADILTFAQALFGGMSDARDGFASDIEHEKN